MNMTSDPRGRPVAPAIPTATSTTVVADRAIDAQQFQPMPQPEMAISDRAVPAIATPAAKANVPQTCIIEEDDPRAILDGFDPADYVWVPVPRQRRPDGWSHAKQRIFIEHLADTGSVTAAATQVDMSVNSCYALRRAPGAEQFAAAWTAAVQSGVTRLADLALERAMNGVEVPVFDKNGRRIACRYKYSDRILRARMPERYGHAHRTTSAAHDSDRPMAPRIASVAQAIALLEPATPDHPEALLTEQALCDRLQDIQDLGGADFVLPQDASGQILRDRSHRIEEERVAEIEFDRRLEWAKIGVAPPPPTGYPPSPYADASVD
jgi:hypothetical protein